MGKKIVLFVGSRNAFYVFDPGDIVAHTRFVNFKDGSPMQNFSIELGQKVKK